MITATIQSITKINSTDINVQVAFSDNSFKDFQFPIDVERIEIRQVIKAELEVLNSFEGKIERLRNLVGETIA